MALAGLPLLGGHPTALLVASRLGAGAGEGVMMSAAVLWPLRLAGEGRRGRALGHIGLANYGGLTLGPLLTDALGHRPVPVFAAAVALPVAGGLPALALRSPQGSDQDADAVGARDLVALTLRPGLGLLLVNVGYVALLSFGTGCSSRGSTRASGSAGRRSACSPARRVPVERSRALPAPSRARRRWQRCRGAACAARYCASRSRRCLSSSPGCSATSSSASRASGCSAIATPTM
jgi:MFS family permease